MRADVPIKRAFDLTGQVLGGRYEVLGKLGEGGMASVYEGRRVGLRNRVAIKVLKFDLSEDEGNVRRFLREARAASVIEHENIVDILDFGEVDALPVFYVMEFLDGEDLRALLKRMGPLSWEQAKPILLQVAAALEAAHLKGIIHRDVKPANIFLLPDPSGQPRVKMLDFGIAKVIEEVRGMTGGMTMTNGILGTVAYMAPEQARSQKLDARTDVYQLGVVAYQMLTGSVPFQGRNPFMVLGQHVNDAPRPPREVRAGIPEEAEAIVLTCLAKDPDHRFQSMTALRGALMAAEQASAPSAVQVAPGLGATGAWSPPVHMGMSGNTTPRPLSFTEKLGSGRHPIVHSQRTGTVPLTSSVPAPAPPSPEPPGGIAPATQIGHTDPMPSTTEPLPSPEPTPVAGSGLRGVAVVIGGAAIVTALAFWASRDGKPSEPSPSPTEPAVAPAATPATPTADRPTPTPTPEPEPEPEPSTAVEVDPPEPVSAPEPEPQVEPPPIRRPKPPKINRPPVPRPTPQPEPQPQPAPQEPGDTIHPDLKNPYG